MERIVAVDDIPEDGFLFTVQENDSGTEREAFVIKESGDVFGWFNYCQHITTVNLDKGRGLPRRGDQVICQNHGAIFNIDDGVCTHGPCKDAELESIDITITDETVYLDSDEYDFVHDGGIDDDDFPSSTTGESF